MGLDWNPGNKPKPGFEEEYEQLLVALKGAPGPERDTILARFFAVSTSAFETLHAPRVGFDDAANEWAKAQYAKDPAAAPSLESYMCKLHGFHVVALVPPCDGLPPYSNGALGYVEAFSFRAQFLTDCEAVLGEHLLNEAYAFKTAPALVEYGHELLRCARTYAEKHGCLYVEELGDELDTIGDSEAGDPPAIAHVIFSAAKWCLFWGSRGHVLDPYW